MGLETLKRLEQLNKSEALTTLDREDADTTSLAQAEEVARHSRQLLATQGWCLWKCGALGDEVIAVVVDENVAGVPRGCPTYTELELAELTRGNIAGSTLRLIHEAKKLAGAVVMGVEDAKPVPRQNHSQTEPVRRCECGSTDFWLREASQWGKAEWLCSRCHPRPGERETRGNNDDSSQRKTVTRFISL